MGSSTPTRVLNFWGGPCSGKSTVKAGTFFHLKINGARAAQIEEYATECSFDRDFDSLSNQRKVLEEQERRQRRMLGQVDWIVTDSPLLLSCIYSSGPYRTDAFHREVFERFDLYDNVNIWLERPDGAYQTYGRHHNEAEAREIDLQLLELLEGRIDFRVKADETTPQRVMEFLAKRFK
ncbi:P-loop containing nucleoside triphosphate hydrolase [Brevundimonas phage vB_BpoS-Kikimora]|uniref:P-loop containing nucleoside triphosphate hydrolase n=1 Tax=Brevundimonas phage vB_BpoS-Kikimora TaxID=2948601 RepID=A0A9E7MT00_9CAUD|nr:P-loop containing nucleoside triphosphate hydrolase [Brevundimonas phage vB_BpoS-Kikimora]